MTYRLLHELLEHLEQFEREMGQRPIQDFALWLYDKCIESDLNPNVKPDPNFGRDVNAEIGYGLSILYQHSRQYIRKALIDSELNGMQDFGFLADLVETGDMTKSQLIDLHFLDYSPGMEVIRRLIKRGLVDDYPDPNDARSRKVRATGKGKQEFFRVLGRIKQAGQVIGGNLESREKLRALGVIRKLLQFHQRIWREDREKTLDEILDKYPELKS